MKTNQEEKRYFLGVDNSSHWYLVELNKSEQWYKWANLDENNPKSWTTPKFAIRINRPTHMNFTNPIFP